MSEAELMQEQPPIRFEDSTPPQLIVVIDTEEEFDWSASPNPKADQVSAMEHIGRAQEIFDQYGVTPCYVLDYPVASQEQGYSELLKIFKDKRCEIGAHLHPWVNPPIDEEICIQNTFPGNLKRELELEKLRVLTEQIKSTFGHQPNIYKAGRYGVGANTPSIMKELGYQIDLSVCPPVDYRSGHGPDFSNSHAEPFWFGDQKDLLEIPVTGAFSGWAGRHQKAIYNLGEKFPQLKLNGIFSRLGVVDRLRLSPEGFTAEEHIKVTNYLHKRGVKTFSWTFHSPSVVPGHTGYVKDEKELVTFLDSFRRYFDYFFGELKGEASTPTKILEKCQNLRDG